MFDFSKLGRKERIIIEQVSLDEVHSEDEGSRVSSAQLKFDISVAPDKAMGMLLSGLMLVTDKFIETHNQMLTPCDCLAIHFAESIARHTKEIDEDIKTYAAGRMQQNKKK